MTQITIRHSERNDIESIRKIYSSKSGSSGTLQLPYSSQNLWESRLESIPEGFYSLVADLNGEAVGHLGLEVYKNPRRKHVANFGMAVLPEYQGQGIGSQLVFATVDLAENWLNIIRIEITVYTDNKQAISLYKKHGFTVEGESPNYAFRNGQYISVYHMAKIK